MANLDTGGKGTNGFCMCRIENEMFLRLKTKYAQSDCFDLSKNVNKCQAKCPTVCKKSKH